jgi:hypothetical protein
MGPRFPRPRVRWLLAAAGLVCVVTLAAMPAPARNANKSAIEASGPAEMELPPPDLRIGDVHFDVKLEAFADTYVGMTHFATHTVQIDPSAQAEGRRRVYLHEMLHVAWHNGRSSTDKNRLFTEEEAIQALTPGLLKMLEENPQAVAYLRAGAASRAQNGASSTASATQDNQLLRTTASK